MSDEMQRKIYEFQYIITYHPTEVTEQITD